MTRIPVERKGKPGVPWWVWLLALLVLLGIIWWITVASADQPHEERDSQDTIPAQPLGSAPGTVPRHALHLRLDYAGAFTALPPSRDGFSVSNRPSNHYA